MNAQRPKAHRSFAVIPPPAYVKTTLVVLLVALGGVVPLAVIASLLWFDVSPFKGFAAAPALVIVPVVIASMLVTMRRRSVDLASGMLDIRAAVFREQVPVADIDLARARVVNLAERTDLRPFMKTIGMALPGFHAGRFRLRGKLARAFCVITDRRRVLWLPLRDGKNQLLLSLEQPQSLLDALQELAPPDPKRR